MSSPITFKQKLFLALFGLTLGSLCAGGVWLVKRPHAAVVEKFESMDDLRRAMLKHEEGEELRSTALSGIIYPHPSDSIIFDLRPDMRTTFQKVFVATNSCGMRDIERSVAKPPNVTRIALLGDSFAFGWGVDQDKSFAAVLERNLNRAASPGQRVEVLNFGTPGYSTFQEVAKFEETGLDFQPDAVLVYFIDNDFGLPFYVKDIMKPGEFVSSSEMIHNSRQGQSEALVEQRRLMESFNPNSALRRLSDIVRERGIKLYVAFNPRKKWRKQKNKLWIIRHRPDIRVIAMTRDYRKAIKRRQWENKELQLPGDPHPNAIKHQLLGDILTPRMMEVLG